MSPKYLVAAVLAAALTAPVSAQSVKAGIDAWQRADYTGAVGIWRPLAEGGDADAQFNLGQAYRLGRGVPLDLSAAKLWFERAARSGHVDAQTTLGLLTFQNGDRVEGLKWLKAAEALYQRVSGKAALAGRGPYYVAMGSVTRLQVGPFASKGAAAAACGAVGVPCFPVPAK